MSLVKRRKEMLCSRIKKDVVDTILSMIRSNRPIIMDDIAKNAGVAKGTLYNYFSSRKEIVSYVHETVLLNIHQTNLSILSSDKDPYIKLVDFISAIFRMHEDVNIYFRFIQKEKTMADALSERFELVIKPLAQLCREGIEAGRFRDADPFIMAEMLDGMIFGSLKSMEFRGMSNSDLEGIRNGVIKIIDKMIIKNEEQYEN